MAGQLTENEIFNFCDYSAGYISLVLGRCALISLAVFGLALLLRGAFLKGCCFRRGMAWGLLLVAPFLGKLRVHYEMQLFAGMLGWWDVLCIEHWWIRHGYLAGVMLGAGLMWRRRRKLSGLVREMEKKTFCGQQVYLNELPVTPFSVGLLSPKIVLPRRMEQGFSEEELRFILLHEKVHIRSGHLWFYLAWDLCQMILWINPLFLLCRESFREDLEDICDRITIQSSGGAAKAYGEALLKCMKELGGRENKGVASFAKRQRYGLVRRRFKRIAGFEPYGRFRTRALGACGAAVLAGALVMVWAYSFPPYTEIREVILMDDFQGRKVILPDNRQLREAVSWDGSRVYIDCEAMDELLREHQFEGERFWLGIGGYTKIPSMGGGGSIVYVDYGEHGKELCIPYCNGEDKTAAALLKWIL